jgi:hypothetical protein
VDVQVDTNIPEERAATIFWAEQRIGERATFVTLCVYVQTCVSFFRFLFSSFIMFFTRRFFRNFFFPRCVYSFLLFFPYFLLYEFFTGVFLYSLFSVFPSLVFLCYFVSSPLAHTPISFEWDRQTRCSLYHVLAPLSCTCIPFVAEDQNTMARVVRQGRKRGIRMHPWVVSRWGDSRVNVLFCGSLTDWLTAGLSEL